MTYRELLKLLIRESLSLIASSLSPREAMQIRLSSTDCDGKAAIKNTATRKSLLLPEVQIKRPYHFPSYENKRH